MVWVVCLCGSFVVGVRCVYVSVIGLGVAGVCSGVWVGVVFGVGGTLPGLCVVGVCGGVWVCVGFGIGRTLPGLCVVGVCGVV